MDYVIYLVSAIAVVVGLGFRRRSSVVWSCYLHHSSEAGQ